MPDTLKSSAVFMLEKAASLESFHIEDAYKWLYQATMGGEHAIADDTGPRRWLDEEWSTLDTPFPDESLVEELLPDGSMLRVNLRPYRAQGGANEEILQLFVASTQAFKGDKDEFLSVWRELRSLVEVNPSAHLNVSEWERFNGLAKPNYPACHHSSAYELALKPAYRLVVGRLWKGLE